MSDNRAEPITVRLAPDLKRQLEAAAEAAGLEPSIAARMVLTSFLGRCQRRSERDGAPGLLAELAEMQR